jgi:hypothetical protein
MQSIEIIKFQRRKQILLPLIFICHSRLIHFYQINCHYHFLMHLSLFPTHLSLSLSCFLHTKLFQFLIPVPRAEVTVEYERREYYLVPSYCNFLIQKKIYFYRNAKIFRTIMYFTATIHGWYEVDKKGHTNIGYCQQINQLSRETQTLETTK